MAASVWVFLYWQHTEVLLLCGVGLACPMAWNQTHPRIGRQIPSRWTFAGEVPVVNCSTRGKMVIEKEFKT